MATAADLRARLAAGETAVGAWLTVASNQVAEAMASLGFHWLAVDMEHCVPGIEAAEAAFIAAERHGCTPLVRLPSADGKLAARLLDVGAAGVLVPQVDDAAAFREFLAHLAYPPNGRRGAALGRFNGWGRDFHSYWRDFRPFVVPQIESRAGAEAAGELAAMPEVDALILGPYDLSGDLGTPGDFSTDAFAEAAARVRTACEAAGKPLGCHQVEPDAGALRQRVDEGYRFIAYATDMIAMRHALSGIGAVSDG